MPNDATGMMMASSTLIGASWLAYSATLVGIRRPSLAGWLAALRGFGDFGQCGSLARTTLLDAPPLINIRL